MSYSPALAHRQRVLASLAASAVASEGLAPPMPETGPVAGEYQQLLVALGDDLRRLQDIQSIERKIEAKRAMIDRYRPWVEGALVAATSGGSAPQDEIVAQMLVWAIDIADWPLALAVGAHVLAHNLTLPQRYVRKPAALLAEQVAEAGLKKPAEVGIATLQEVVELTAEADMHDQIRAKLEKALALGFVADADAFDPEADSARAGGKAPLVAAALDHARRALTLDKNAGVKKLIEQLERDQKNAAPAAQTGAPA